MQKIKSQLLFLLLPLIVLSQTQIESGSVSGIWSSENSPYHVNGDIDIPLGATLTIEPGTAVYFTGEYQFDVYGQLIAEGTETDSIFFHSDSMGYTPSWPYFAGFWYGITFHATDSTGQAMSSLDYCKVSYAYERWLDEASIDFNRRFGGGLIMYKSSVDLSNTVIEDCTWNGLVAIYSGGSYDGVTLTNAGAIELIYSDITMNSMHVSQGTGMVFENSQAEITNSVLSGNVNSYGSQAIIFAEDSDLNIQNCEIIDNDGNGIRIDASTLNIENTLIQENNGGLVSVESIVTMSNCEVIENSGIGLFFNSATDWQTTYTSDIQNTLVAKNNGGGFKFYTNNNANITNCTIVDNHNPTSRGGIINGSVDTNIKNSIIYNNGANLDFQAGGLYTYSIVQGNYVGQDEPNTNLHNYDPVFRDASNGDYRLQSVDCGSFFESPGIDAGDPAISDYVLDCATAGLGAESSDMGAYGGAANRWDDTVLPACHFTGDVSGIWDCETIYLEDDVVIPLGDTLQIMESVDRVHILGPYEIKVEGVLIAIGPESDHVNAHGDYIKFQGSDWHGIIFNNLNDTDPGASIIENCRFDYADKLEAAYPKGGAILIYNSDEVTVRHSFFYSNRAVLGGAMYVENASPTIEDCKFEINGRILSTDLEIITTAGGALYLKNASPNMRKLQFVKNGANDGGAIFLDHSSPTMTNILVVKNEALGFAGGIFVDGSSPRIVNMTAADNFAANGGGTFSLMRTTSQPEVMNSIMWGNSKPEIYINDGTPIVTYSIIDSADTESYYGLGCLDADPLFQETYGNVYRLPSTACGVAVSSIAIDAGHPDSLDAVVACDEGLGTQHADMGYYGGMYSPEIILGIDGSADLAPTRYQLSQNYPNPFNPSTRINFALPQSGQVDLVIFNALGQEVMSLVDQQLDAGNHTVQFQASHLNSGVYFYRITADNYSANRKMILLK
ncbi:MAG: right-handed parallel beta-helix repeat-containing protein [Candidatus Marinimicrobia bacterium]|nr:right-handed parallel beta-helix repeat-containing protein [Candidatus Neomarinimicrobiota bacterium]